MNGKIELWELISEDFFAILRDSFRLKIKKELKREKSLSSLAREVKISLKILTRSLNGKSAIRLDVLSVLLEKSGCNWKEAEVNLLELKGWSGGCIKKPIFPLDFTTTSGVRLIAALLGDGCVSQKYSMFYTNSNKDLVNGFCLDFRNTFGEAEFVLRDDGYMVVIECSKIFGRIVSKLGLIPGAKVENNVAIPEFIFSLDDTLRAAFLSQLFDDEGSVNLSAGHLKINFALVESHEKSELVYGFARLLESFGIFSSIYRQKGYTHINGVVRSRWQLQVHGGFQIKKIAGFFTLRHGSKRQKLNVLAESLNQNVYLKRNCQQIYFECMAKVIGEKGYFTSDDLVKPLNRKLGHVRNMLHKYLKKGLIVQRIPAKLTAKGSFPAQYTLHNEIHNGSSHSREICESDK